jgi:hypothetical protein
MRLLFGGENYPEVEILGYLRPVFRGQTCSSGGAILKYTIHTLLDRPNAVWLH